jgi:hypothetical protein
MNLIKLGGVQVRASSIAHPKDVVYCDDAHRQEESFFLN